MGIIYEEAIIKDDSLVLLGSNIHLWIPILSHIYIEIVVALEINGGARVGWLFWVTSYGFVLPKKGVQNEGFMSSFDYDSLHCEVDELAVVDDADSCRIDHVDSSPSVARIEEHVSKSDALVVCISWLLAWDIGP